MTRPTLRAEADKGEKLGSDRCRLLVIEDDADIAQLIGLHLSDLACEVVYARDGLLGLQLALGGKFDLIILDLGLPRLDGLEICRKVRELPTYTPILILTARSSDVDRVVGLEMGGDDYLSKPFNVRELIARVKAVLRRRDAAAAQSAAAQSAIIRVGALSVELATRRVKIDRRPIDLTAREFDLLAQFAQNPGRVFTRAQLLDLVWGYAHTGYEHTVNTHINRLRAKIEEDPSQPRYIQTSWGVGYRFTDEYQADIAADAK